MTFRAVHNNNQATVNCVLWNALTLLVGQQEGRPACTKAGCWFVGGDDLTGALHDL